MCKNKEFRDNKVAIGLGNNFTRKIIQYNLEGKIIKAFKSIASTAKEMGVTNSNIQCVIK